MHIKYKTLRGKHKSCSVLSICCVLSVLYTRYCLVGVTIPSFCKKTLKHRSEVITRCCSSELVAKPHSCPPPSLHTASEARSLQMLALGVVSESPDGGPSFARGQNHSPGRKNVLSRSLPSKRGQQWAENLGLHASLL